MRYLVIFLFVLLAFAAALFIIKIRVIIEFKRNGWDDYLSITFSAFWGMLKYEYEIPLIDLDKDGVKLQRVKKMKPGTIEKGEGKKLLGIFEIYDKISFSIDFYKKNKKIICAAKNYTKGRFILEEYSLKVEAGTGDAFQTGILSGMLWTVAGMLTSFILSNFKTLKSCVDIKPAFTEEKLNIDLLCIFCAKIAHIIKVILMIFINYKRNTRESKIKHKIGGGLVG